MDASSDVYYYRDCSNYGPGWARMGGHGRQLRLDGNSHYVETSLSGASAERDGDLALVKMSDRA